MKLRLKGRRFDTTEDIHAETQEVIDTLTFENFHEIMGNMLGSLYTCPRGLLRRRWWKLGVTVRNFFLWSNSPNFWVSPCSVSFHVTTSLVL